MAESVFFFRASAKFKIFLTPINCQLLEGLESSKETGWKLTPAMLKRTDVKINIYESRRGGDICININVQDNEVHGDTRRERTLASTL